MTSPRVSVFTPSHNPRFLNDAYASLAAQTYSDWEWIVLLNGAAKEWRPPSPDERVRVVRGRGVPKRVGAAKHAACAEATGELLVELDHDDTLASTCLERVVAAFEANPNAVFVFSDFAQVNEDLTRNDNRFNAAMGWTYDEVQVDGASYLQCNSMAPSPHNMAFIWFEPNHVRAFRRSTYEEVGGYNPQLTVLDDQDLMLRLYLAGDFVHLTECLYFQRLHGKNTQVDPTTNAFIQEETVRYYYAFIEPLAANWSRRQGLDVISLGIEGSTAYLDDDPGTVVSIDPHNPILPFADNSVGLVKMAEVLQRVPDRAALFNELHRVGVHGAIITTRTPSTDGRGAFQDPSHVAFYNENSFWYLTQERLRGSIPSLTARLQLSRMRTYYPTDFEERFAIPYVQANLIVIKDGPRQGGELLA